MKRKSRVWPCSAQLVFYISNIYFNEKYLPNTGSTFPCCQVLNKPSDIFSNMFSCLVLGVAGYILSNLFKYLNKEKLNKFTKYIKLRNEQQKSPFSFPDTEKAHVPFLTPKALSLSIFITFR